MSRGLLACLLAALVAVGPAAASVEEASEGLASELAVDDECAEGEECSLNALQLRGKAVDGDGQEDFGEGEELPENTTDAELGSAPDGYLANSCRNGGYCVMAGYLIVAGKGGAVGMESINGGNVGYYNHMMSAAYHRCGGSNCVLITNPRGFRSQSRFHIHYRHMNGHGSHLKSRMEKAACSKDGWVKGGFPCHGKAKHYSSFPGVFSAAMGAGSISSAAVSVWPGSCGHGVIVLVSYHCSIEHSIAIIPPTKHHYNYWR